MKKYKVLAIVLVLYFLWNHWYFFIPTVEQLGDSQKFKIHDVVTTHSNYYIGADLDPKLRYRELYVDKTGKPFLLLRKDIRLETDHELFAYSINKDLTLNLQDSIPDNLTPIYYTQFISGEDDAVHVHRNEYRKLSRSVNNADVLFINKEPYLLWFFKNLPNFFCWSLNPFDCGTSGRSATYIVRLNLRAGSLKIQIPGDMGTSRATFYYFKDPEKDRVVLLKYGKKMIVIESLE